MDRELGLADWNIWNVFAPRAFPLRMKRYYFDIRKDDVLAADEEGLIMRGRRRRFRWLIWRARLYPAGGFIAWQ